MINKVGNHPISFLLNGDDNIFYRIPRYQREYSWGKVDWEHLFDDLVDNDAGYFLGSIICIDQSDDAFIERELELVDGQQRMTTVSLFLAAIYDSLLSYKNELDEDQRADLNNLKHRLVLKRTEKMRLVPQAQNNNLQDYQAVLAEIGLLENIQQAPYAGIRKIFKAYRYFKSRIEQYCENEADVISKLFGLLDSVNQAALVIIQVNTHSDAYILFESLNNRGKPLTAIDLIKNKLLAEVGKKDESKIDYSFDQWKKLLEYLTDDYGIQERFFRHYYNAFLGELRESVKVSFATKSKLIEIYQKLINDDVFGFIKKVTEAGQVYSQIIGESEIDEMPSLEKPLQNLERIQGTPSYVLLLFLWLKRNELLLDESNVKEVIEILVKFFVRRNLTDVPPTRDIDRLFVALIATINEKGLTGNEIVLKVRSELRSVSVPLETMMTALKGEIYDDNASVTRFVLCALEESTRTRETKIDLWEIDKHNKYVMTIEHIFPQGKNIPEAWVDMIADGNRDLANEYRDQYVHRLGNLTISGFNSTLGTKSFEEKRDRKDKKNRYVGYKNGFDLNAELVDKSEWKIEDINERTDNLAQRIAKMYAYVGET